MVDVAARTGVVGSFDILGYSQMRSVDDGGCSINGVS